MELNCAKWSTGVHRTILYLLDNIEYDLSRLSCATCRFTFTTSLLEQNKGASSNAVVKLRVTVPHPYILAFMGPPHFQILVRFAYGHHSPLTDPPSWHLHVSHQIFFGYVTRA